MGGKECLLEKTGSCMGCPVPGKVLDKRKEGLSLEKEPILIATLSETHCPPGATMRVPRRKEQRVW